MDSSLRAGLKRQIQAYVEKNPNAELKEVREWVLRDNQLLQGVEVNSRTLKSFNLYQFSKFKSGHDVIKHRGWQLAVPRFPRKKRGQF